ncbi:hypothetical protein [Erythrobacter neustonensis]|uniref:Uncharacterized protein n=1 Tax=Erythrobacter neustonensis TaxID=1112 RepID=A0A192D329_9SPHN|nr:hypothetical protein [Erythrobacter neustonensis]ANK12401.1 hypothetical protein A9D12_04945 [Erythrobacter neustonensis]
MSAAPDAALLTERIAARLAVRVDPAVEDFARALADAAGAVAVLFYGSNLRTGSLDGVLDFYLLIPGKREAAIWPEVSYHERANEGETLRAKVATMRLATFAKAASGELADTTIWARFVQPSALIWTADETARAQVIAAVASAATTAARLAAALGPENGTAEDYWRALFRATYAAEFRVEKGGRENDILSVNADHFAGLLPLALAAGGIDPGLEGARLTPKLGASERARILHWWQRRRRLGKPLNLLRLVKASTTFEGAARYAAWKIERHTGMPVKVTPFRERFPLLAAPQVLWELSRHRRQRR